ncbi:hypothetical protein SAMN05443636_2914 [Halobaculum gomorrense]|uniref:Uncharacterized protein n=1 Tax=Halobaculum gomorrense TaxID=43928 RepID=A0A1M5U4V3_9EURY|nr:hypothetical protein SAMN05443636_2914 [Halobaculum gomorrense]
MPFPLADGPEGGGDEGPTGTGDGGGDAAGS